jgi:hypothetical protein
VRSHRFVAIAWHGVCGDDCRRGRSGDYCAFVDVMVHPLSRVLVFADHKNSERRLAAQVASYLQGVGRYGRGPALVLLLTAPKGGEW